MKLFYVPLEPLEHRCFGHWYDALFNAFGKEFDEVVRISPESADRNDAGDTGIMDTLSSTKWKLWQLEAIRKAFEAGEVKPNDVFFFDDTYFPGIEMVRFISDLLKIPISITGCLHGGSWIEGDYVRKLGDWPMNFEALMFTVVDKFILATDYHGQMIFRKPDPMSRCMVGSKMFVTGYPVQNNEIQKYATMPVTERANIIVYAQRIDEQKRTLEVLKAIDHLWDLRQDFMFVITSSTTSKLNADDVLHIRIKNLKDRMGEQLVIKEGLTRKEYFELLGESKVFISLAKGETFGYALVESLAAGVSPVVCEGVTHNEILLDDYRFICLSDDQVPFLLSKRLDEPIDMRHLVARYNDDEIFKSIAHIVRWTNKGVCNHG